MVWESLSPFEKLHQDRYYINKLMEIQFILGGCQKIAKIYDFIDINTILDAFPFQINNFKYVEKTSKNFSKNVLRMNRKRNIQTVCNIQRNTQTTL